MGECRRGCAPAMGGPQPERLDLLDHRQHRGTLENPAQQTLTPSSPPAGRDGAVGCTVGTARHLPATAASLPQHRPGRNPTQPSPTAPGPGRRQLTVRRATGNTALWYATAHPPHARLRQHIADPAPVPRQHSPGPETGLRAIALPEGVDPHGAVRHPTPYPQQTGPTTRFFRVGAPRAHAPSEAGQDALRPQPGHSPGREGDPGAVHGGHWGGALKAAPPGPWRSSP